MAGNRGRTGKRWQQARANVINRDTYCGVPGCPKPNEPIDKNAPRYLIQRDRTRKLNPWAPEADHIDGYTTQAEMLDESRMRLAHAQCNNRKGDKSDTALGQLPPTRRNINSREW